MKTKDILEKIDVEDLKWTCRTLRFFCYSNCINLLYSSIKKPKIIKNLYNLIVNFTTLTEDNFKFKCDALIDKNDVNPLFIQYYADNYTDIGDPKIL